jgi:hypothetical protein
MRISERLDSLPLSRFHRKLVGGWILGNWPGRQDRVFAQFALVVFVGLVAVVCLGRETMGRSLEEITA